VSGINMQAFFDELVKIGQTQAREPTSAWAPKTIGAPRAKLPDAQVARAPEPPGALSPKVVKPAGQYGNRQNYSKPYTESSPATNPEQGESQRQAPIPNVTFGVR